MQLCKWETWTLMSLGDGRNPYLLQENRSSIDCRFLSVRSDTHHTCNRPCSRPLSCNCCSLGFPLDCWENCRCLYEFFGLHCFCIAQIIPEYVKSRKALAASGADHRYEGARCVEWWWNAHPGGDTRIRRLQVVD